MKVEAHLLVGVDVVDGEGAGTKGEDGVNKSVAVCVAIPLREDLRSTEQEAAAPHAPGLKLLLLQVNCLFVGKAVHSSIFKKAVGRSA